MCVYFFYIGKFKNYIKTNKKTTNTTLKIGSKMTAYRMKTIIIIIIRRRQDKGKISIQFKSLQFSYYLNSAKSQEQLLLGTLHCTVET